ncbi:hypothetical protein ZWY2020_014020 [Hordeum vulgare]|nr:hypothetical protein ZWY2020_014020 [Hordeum vulgare]
MSRLTPAACSPPPSTPGAGRASPQASGVQLQGQRHTPARVRPTVALRRRNLPRDAALASVLDGLMASCEVSTMRAFVDGITGF